MTRRRRNQIVGAMIALTTVVAFAACTFPEVKFTDDASRPDGSVADGGDANAVGDARGDGGPKKPDVDPEGGAKDAATLGDATTVIDAAGCKTCDCDEDGFDRFDLDAGCDGSAPYDCDDTVRAINPDQTDFVRDLWPAGAKHKVVGDWDCSGTTTRQYDYDAVCAALSACQGGFEGNPPCGATAPFISCNDPLPLLGLLCSEKTREKPGDRTQACH